MTPHGRSAAPELMCADLLCDAPQTKNAAAIMRVLHYPPQTGPVDDRVIGIGAHTEYVLPRAFTTGTDIYACAIAHI